MQIDECLEMADLWFEFILEDTKDWRTVCKTLADEVRRLRCDTQEVADARAFLRDRDALLRELAEAKALAASRNVGDRMEDLIADERKFPAIKREIIRHEQDRYCAIVFGMCDSDNVAQRTVDAIRGKASSTNRRQFST